MPDVVGDRVLTINLGAFASMGLLGLSSKSWVEDGKSVVASDY